VLYVFCLSPSSFFVFTPFDLIDVQYFRVMSYQLAADRSVLRTLGALPTNSRDSKREHALNALGEWRQCWVSKALGRSDSVQCLGNFDVGELGKWNLLRLSPDTTHGCC